MRRRRPFLCAVLRGITGNRDIAAVQVRDLAADTPPLPRCATLIRTTASALWWNARYADSPGQPTLKTAP